jgi:hypothetical protein
MIWIGWDGREIGSGSRVRYYDDPAISPDGSKLAFAKRESDSASQDIWVLDLETACNAASRRILRMTGLPSGLPTVAKLPSGRSVKVVPVLYRKKANGVGDESARRCGQDGHLALSMVLGRTVSGVISAVQAFLRTTFPCSI